MRRVCFYHRADLDGKCSGAIVYDHFRHDIEMVGINYGDDYERVVFSRIDMDTVVVMVDFSMQPWSEMARLAGSCKHLIWIDHHIEAIKQYEKWQDIPDDKGPWKIEGYREDGVAACVLTWRFFNNNEPVPRAVELLGLYDIWKWEGVDGAMELQMGMRMEETDPVKACAMWFELFLPPGLDGCPTLQKLIEQGGSILKYQRQQNKIHIESAGFETEWRGMRWLAINEMFANSTLFDARYDPEKHHGMIAFGWRGGRWYVSMYTTRSDVDVGAICTAVGTELGTGGGGHKKAGGFQARTLPFTLKWPT